MKTLFISSAIQDMAMERELLHQQMLPRLNDAARQYGETVELCDLRWGSGNELDSEQGSHKLLSVCLDEIDRCGSYMIVLLGQHYGHIPDADLVRSAAADRPGLTLEDLEKSVTALEIEYGALARKGRQDRALFYFREIVGSAPGIYRPESNLHAKRLEELKQRIRALAGARVKTYRVRWDERRGGFTGLDDFARMVESDVKALLTPHWQVAAKQDDYQRDLRGQWELVHQRARDHSGRTALVSRCIREIENRTEPTIVRGPAGTGKSALMGKLAQEFERRGDQVLPIFCGSSRLCRTAGDILRYMIRTAEDILKTPESSAAPKGTGEEPAVESTIWEDQQERLNTLLARYSQEREETLVILIDDADQLLNDAEREALCFLPGTLPERIKIVLSCGENFPLSQTAGIIAMERLGEAETTEVVQGILRGIKQELDKSVIEALTKKPGADNPLYLNLLIQRILLMDKDGHTVRPDQQIRLIQSCPGNLTDLYMDILSAVTGLLGNHMAIHAGAFLAISRHGLRQSDLEGIFRRMRLPWDELSFARLRKFMGRLLFQRGDGRVDFCHQTMREVLLTGLKDHKVLHCSVMRHLRSLDADDELRIGELTYHTIQAGQWQEHIEDIEGMDEADPALTEAAKAVSTMVVSQGSQWLMELIEKGMAYGCGQRYLTFLGEPLAEALAKGHKKRLLHRDILLATVRLAETRAEALGSEESVRTVTACRNRAGEACCRLGDRESLEIVSRMREKQLAVAEALVEREDTPEGRQKLMAAYAEVAAAYEKRGNREDHLKALALHEKRLACQELVIRQESQPDSLPALAIEYEKYARLYRDMGQQEELRRAADLQRKALELRRELAEKSGTPEDQRLVLGSTLVWGQLCAEIEDAAYWHGAQQELEATCERQKNLADAQDSPESRAELAALCCAMGEMYVKRQEREELLKALEWYQQSFLLRRALSREQATAQSRIDLAVCYERLGEVYQLLGGMENLHRALELLNRSLSLRRKLHGKLESTDSALALAVALHQMGQLCAAFGGEENLRQARGILESALPLHQWVREREPVDGIRPEMQRLQAELAEVYAELARIETERIREEERRKAAQEESEAEELSEKDMDPAAGTDETDKAE